MDATGHSSAQGKNTPAAMRNAREVTDLTLDPLTPPPTSARRQTARLNLSDANLRGPGTPGSPCAGRAPTEPADPRGGAITLTLADLKSRVEAYEGAGEELISRLETIFDDMEIDMTLEEPIRAATTLGGLKGPDLEDLTTLTRQYAASIRDLATQVESCKGPTVEEDGVQQIVQALDKATIERADATQLALPAAEALNDKINENDDDGELGALNQTQGFERAAPPPSPSPEDECRSKLHELDDRIEIPTDAKLTELEPQTLLLLAAMRSPMALVQLQKLLQEGCATAGGNDTAGEDEATNEDKNLGRLVGICRKIQSTEHQSALACLKLRYYDVQLYLEMERRRAGKVRSSTEDVKEIVKLCDWTQSQFSYHQGLGKTIYNVCNGHIGLAALIPLESSHPFNIAPKKTLHHMTDAQAAALGSIMTDAWASVMCTVGEEIIQAAILNDFNRLMWDVSNLLSTEWDFAILSADHLQQLLDTVEIARNADNEVKHKATAGCSCISKPILEDQARSCLDDGTLSDDSTVAVSWEIGDVEMDFDT